MTYALVDQWQQKASVTQACRVLGVSRSGYYASKQRANTTPISKVVVHLKAAFQASQQTYGSRRLMVAIRERGLVMGRSLLR